METATESPTPNPREHPWLFAFATGAFVLAAGLGVQLVAWESRACRGALLHVSLVGAVAALACRAAVDGVARRCLGTRGPVVAWRAVAAAALALAGAHVYSLGYLLHSGWSFFEWFGRLWELEPEYGAVPAVAFVAAAALARLRVATRRRLRVEAWLATALACALIALGAARASRAPEVHRYVASLPEAGVVAPAGGDLRWQAGRESEPSSRFEDFTAGGLVVRRYAFDRRGQCGVILGRAGSDLPPSVTFERAREAPCDRLSVRVDRAHGVVVLHRQGPWSARNVGFDLATLDPLPESGAVARLAGAFSLPRAWLRASAAVLAFAFAGLAGAHRARRALQGWAAWRQGTLRADGLIAFDDGSSPVPCPYGAGLAPGPVVLLDGARGAQGASPFREATVAPTPERDAVRAGTVAGVLATFEAGVDARYAYATAAAFLAAAPWAAALCEGLIP